MKTPHVKGWKKEKKRLICSYCEKVCKTKFDLRVHEAVHTGNKPLKCEVCDAAFAVKSRLNQHMKRHHTYSCTHPGCGFEAEKWSLLRKHLPVHNIKCPLCYSKFKSQASLDKHVLTHESTFPCPQCERQYAKRSNLLSHVKAVHQKLTFKCSVPGCEKEFSFKKSLRQHVKTHTERQDKHKSGPSITMRRVVTAAVLSGYDPNDEEKRMTLNQDKAFRMNVQSDVSQVV